MGASDTVAEAVAAIDAAAELQVTAAGGPGADLPPVKLDREGVERRVLGHITDEEDTSALGPRNTLAALTYAIVRDQNTTNPPAGKPRLDVDGLSTAEAAQAVLDILELLIGEGLVKQRKDGSYELTDAGHLELAS